MSISLSTLKFPTWVFSHLFTVEINYKTNIYISLYVCLVWCRHIILFVFFFFFFFLQEIICVYVLRETHVAHKTWKTNLANKVNRILRICSMKQVMDWELPLSPDIRDLTVGIYFLNILCWEISICKYLFVQYVKDWSATKVHSAAKMKKQKSKIVVFLFVKVDWSFLLSSLQRRWVVKI